MKLVMWGLKFAILGISLMTSAEASVTYYECNCSCTVNGTTYNIQAFAEPENGSCYDVVNGPDGTCENATSTTCTRTLREDTRRFNRLAIDGLQNLR